MNKIISIKKIEGEIILKTGLHIGVGSDNIEIGGMDNSIIKNPLTNEPYIPGSSLKGKLRSIMEWKLNKVQPDGSPCNCGECEICKVFGSGAGTKREFPTMLIIRDAYLTKKWKDRFNDGDQIIEEKWENSINRINGSAVPRQIERVLPGVTFKLDMIVKIYNKEDEHLFNDIIIEALKLIQYDYLGGYGSRGSGKIEIKYNVNEINLN